MHEHYGYVLATIVGLLGSLAVSVWGFLAQVGNGEPDFGQWITGGGAMASATALVYVVRMVANGRLVHRDPATAEEQLRKATAELVRITDAAMKREDDYRRIVRDVLDEKRAHRESEE